jgi:hypothetical protein
MMPCPPEFFGEPVPKLGGVPMDIFPGPQPDPTDRRAADLDTKILSR